MSELLTLQPPSWLISGLIQKATFAILSGEAGVGKSFITLDESLSVVSGGAGMLRAIGGGPMIYVIGEDAPGSSVRARAWCGAHEITPNDETTRFTDGPVQFGGELNTEVGDLTQTIHWIMHRNPSVIIVDTLARCSVGMDENSTKDMGLIVDRISVLCRKLECTLILVHHTTKSNALMSRGSGAIRGAVDTSVIMHKKYKRLHVIAEKQKNGRDNIEISVQLVLQKQSTIPQQIIKPVPRKKASDSAPDLEVPNDL